MEIQGANWYLAYIIIYFILMFGFAFYYFTKVKNADDYLVGNWNMGFWPIVGTVVSTCCGASAFIGSVALAYNFGFSAYLRFNLAAFIVCFILIIFFGKRLRRQRLYTIADFFGQRYGAPIGILPSILSTFIYAIPATAIQFIAMNTIWSMVFGLDLLTSAMLTSTLILCFTILGGLPSTIITDALQAIFIIAAIVILTISSVNFAGGFTYVLENTPPEMLSIAGPFGLSEMLLYAISIGPFFLVWATTWQRIFAAKTERIAVTANSLGMLIGTFITLLPMLIGLSVHFFLPSGIKPDQIFSFITLQLLPPWLGGFIYCALVAAMVTSSNSFILQGSSSLAHDLYKKMICPNADNKKMMIVSRAMVALMTLGAFFVSISFEGIMTVYQWTLRISATTLVIPFLGTMFWRRTTRAGILASMIAGCIACFIHPWLGVSLDQTFFGFAFSALGLSLSFVTKHHKDEYVAAIMYDDLPSAKTESLCK